MCRHFLSNEGREARDMLKSRTRDRRLADIEEQIGQANAHLEYCSYMLEHVTAALDLMPCMKNKGFTIIH